ncbi:hypothetical protein H1Z61_04575 [Bacillus aquiflavi]|uniref:UPF0738 protein G4D64_04540 n=1 Tax=Bacillus aquiflavi TaxID=2672567 RepID=A0A6B3VWV8_9BACI|nr:hypothetical protein [Bacillus aquiflavi]MBA4536437.1 hypothetical protein [Bacillus aquiflavi]NEY80805.1 hypothetical protein [Bacillus aquiflavi]UAC49101.1 hypothetical protein K6959_04175 [Bacillus aquiflavi]
MREKIIINSVSIKDQELNLYSETKQSLTNLKDRGQVLVDSDHFAFIYITENEETFTYIVLHEQIWPELKIALTKNLPVVVVGKDSRLYLNGFHGELNYLIENIKGNSNYGEEMVNKVESLFL